MAPASPSRRSPTVGLLFGLLVTLAAVVAYLVYITRQISGLRALQTDLTDRNRKDTLQLLRVQNDLNLVGLAMRDMLDNDQHYPLIAWSAQLDRIRTDLDDALARERRVALAERSADQQQYLEDSVRQFWDASDRIFAQARSGDETNARAQIGLSLQARQAALSTTVARLLVANNTSEDETARRVQDIYAAVQHQVYWFLGATLVAISLTSLSMIRANRRIFAELALLSERRQELARQLIAARESTLRELARELHDELGQVLTAMGAMLGRTGRQLPPDSPLRDELRDVAEIAQATLESVRGLSQTLHPAILEDAGLDNAIDWHISRARRQTEMDIH